MEKINKMLVLLLSFCFVFCLCACDDVTEIGNDSQSSINDEMHSGDEMNLFEMFIDSWDEYLEYRVSDDFVDTEGQQLFWQIKDKLAELLDFEAIEEVHLVNDNISIALPKTPSNQILLFSICFDEAGRDPYTKFEENDPILNSLTSEDVKDIGDNLNVFRVMLGQRETSVGIKDRNVRSLRFVLERTYEFFIQFNTDFAPDMGEVNTSELKGPITFNERIAFATAFADMVEAELTVVTPPPAVTE